MDAGYITYYCINFWLFVQRNRKSCGGEIVKLHRLITQMGVYRKCISSGENHEKNDKLEIFITQTSLVQPLLQLTGCSSPWWEISTFMPCHLTHIFPSPVIPTIPIVFCILYRKRKKKHRTESTLAEMRNDSLRCASGGRSSGDRSKMTKFPRQYVV